VNKLLHFAISFLSLMLLNTVDGAIPPPLIEKARRTKKICEISYLVLQIHPLSQHAHC
jgi:hypothetical protein